MYASAIGKPSIGFGKASSSDKPAASFKFGEASVKSNDKPSFNNIEKSSSKSDKPSFSFGDMTASKPDKPTFNFGGSSESKSEKPSFQFGNNTATSTFGNNPPKPTSNVFGAVQSNLSNGVLDSATNNQNKSTFGGTPGFNFGQAATNGTPAPVFGGFKANPATTNNNNNEPIKKPASFAFGQPTENKSNNSFSFGEPKAAPTFNFGGASSTPTFGAQQVC